MKLHVQDPRDRGSNQQNASELVMAVAQGSRFVGRRPVAKLQLICEF